MNLFITGIDTGVGKTVVSAILAEALMADYWKPIQSGDLSKSDTDQVIKWVNNGHTVFHPETYRLNWAMSPHISAKIDGLTIQLENIKIPQTKRDLIIEGAGGLLVPLNDKDCIIDLIAELECETIVVSQHYLGSINHTLLSIKALEEKNIPVKGIIFNGRENKDTEEIIGKMQNYRILGRIEQEKQINASIIKRYAKDFRQVLRR